jgi:hypothetical protein
MKGVQVCSRERERVLQKERMLICNGKGGENDVVMLFQVLLKHSSKKKISENVALLR